MNTVLGFLIAISLLLFQHSSQPAANKNIQSFQTAEYFAEKANSTFSAVNQTPVAVGTVTIHLSGGRNAYINVTGSGTFNTDISSSPAYCTINGQNIYDGTPVWITIDAST